LLTTAWVISELGNALSKGNNRQVFLQLYEVLSNSSIHTIVEPSQNLLDQGLGLFAERPDKHWSLTDCISFVIMQQYGLSHALTADHHFEQAGFVAMLTA
jgi:predicted nucleic acid-binding protein